MHVTIRRYRKFDGDQQELLDEINRGFVPMITKLDGFIDYTCLFPKDGSLVAVSVFRDEASALDSVRAATAYVGRNLTRYLKEKPETILGEVAAHVSAKEGGRAVRELYEAINRRDLDAFDRLVSEHVDYVEYGLGEAVHGREALKHFFQKWWKAFPQGSVEVRNLFVVGDQVMIEAVGRGLFTGTFEAERGRAAPTNEMFEFHYAKVFRVRQGVIVNVRSYSDSNQLFSGETLVRKAA